MQEWFDDGFKYDCSCKENIFKDNETYFVKNFQIFFQIIYGSVSGL